MRKTKVVGAALGAAFFTFATYADFKWQIAERSFARADKKAHQSYDKTKAAQSRRVDESIDAVRNGGKKWLLEKNPNAWDRIE